MPTRRDGLLLLAASLGGCGAPPPRRGPTGPVVWPAPPEPARYVHEATLRNAASLAAAGDSADLMRRLSGEDRSRASFGKALAVAAGRGFVYVGDTEGRRIFVFDLPRRRTFSFGLRREGELKKPAGIALDTEGRVHVVDATARRVVVFDALGLFLRQIDGSADWVRPSALAVSAAGDRLYVIDTGGVESNSHRVWVYDGAGRPLGRIGRRGDGPGEFNLPTDAATGPDGSLWVLDAGNFRVQAFDREGRFVRQFGSLGNGIGQFARPRGLAVDPTGLVCVSDAAFCNLQLFQPDGTLLLTIGSRASPGADRDQPGRYLLPAKLAADETGRLYVVDQFLHKVEVLRRLDTGQFPGTG
ncbi:MAG: 6-bladed beta-propeller [Burkholderiaceae bacterium]|nr:6-bladed beta-propeller [Burkholderiaceae bacterium]